MTAIPKTKPVRLKGKAKTQLRRDCFERDSYRCQHMVSYGTFMGPCARAVTWESGHQGSGHMAHIKSLGANGSDTLDNVTTRCAEHHLVDMHNPKSVPKKPR